MIGWFIAWFQRFVELGLKLAAELIAGILSAPFAAARNAARPTVPRPTVRRGTAAEVLDLRHRVLRHGMPRETARFPGDDAPDTRHWVALRGSDVVGVVSVMRAPAPESLEGTGSLEGTASLEGPGWQLRGMAVDEARQGQDIGKALLLTVHLEVGEPMWCNARTGVVGFYEKHGWRAVGEPFEVSGIGPHRRMFWAG